MSEYVASQLIKTAVVLIIALALKLAHTTQGQRPNLSNDLINHNPKRSIVVHLNQT
jgi:hypothetical protein